MSNYFPNGIVKQTLSILVAKKVRTRELIIKYYLEDARISSCEALGFSGGWRSGRGGVKPRNKITRWGLKLLKAMYFDLFLQRFERFLQRFKNKKQNV